jgi:hypothetical protein
MKNAIPCCPAVANSQLLQSFNLFGTFLQLFCMESLLFRHTGGIFEMLRRGCSHKGYYLCWDGRQARAGNAVGGHVTKNGVEYVRLPAKTKIFLKDLY